MIRARFSREKSTAFTLVEMLVSMAVLILIMAFVSQMMTSTTMSTNMSGKHLDADTHARLVFDRMAVDFAGMARRTDVDFIFSKQPDPLSGLSTPGQSGSSDIMFFYSEAPAYYDSTLFSGTTNSTLKSTVALTGYSCINTSGTTTALPAYSLLRFSKGLTWDSTSLANGPGGMMFLTSASPGGVPISASTLAVSGSADIGSPPTYVPANQSDYDEFTDVLSNEVLRMEFCFEVKDLTNPNSPGSAYSNYPIAHFGSGATNKGYAGSPYTNTNSPSGNPGDRWYDTANNRAYACTGYTITASGTTPNWSPNGMADVKAIVVAIAILDPNSRKLLTTSQLGNISGAFVDPTEDANLTTGLLTSASNPTPHLMAEVWQNALNAPGFAGTTGIPKPVAAQIRVYQRFFYLNNP